MQSQRRQERARFPTRLDHRGNAVSDSCLQRSSRRESGFTLLELLVVLGIIVLLAAVVGPRVLKYFSQAKTQTAGIQVGNLSSALELYFLDTGAYPPQEVGLNALMRRPPNAETWNGPYLKKASGLTDPWGNTFKYRFPGQHGEFDVYSLGQDGVEGGTGEARDITNW